jgi:hypothetical protein
MEGKTNGWFMVCMGDGVEDRSVMAHGKANGRWELRGSIKYDELGGHKMFGAYEEGGPLKAHAPLFEDCV